MNPKRVLICGLTENPGGLEIYIMNIYRNLDRSRLQFDFLVYGDSSIAFSDEISQLGGRIHRVPRRRKHPVKHYLSIRKIFGENAYNGLYYQCNRKLQTIELFRLAKKYGIQKRVLHSHNMSDMARSKFVKLREKVTELSYDKYITDYFACSDQAGRWMFHNRNFTVMNNSIDTNAFKYDECTRTAMRNKLNISTDTVVLGTVGRLAYQKNPEFIVEVFNDYHRINPNSVFIHIGDGEERSKIEHMIENYGLSNSYYLMGTQNNVADYLNAMDIFIFPSRYEGFGIVLIEAQAVGLHIIADTSVPRASKVSDLVVYMDSLDSKTWAKEVERIANRIENRIDMSKVVDEKGFGINSLTRKIQTFFES